nr:HAD-IC family P-type ATPase [Kibdelosporangium sp. MJ126-NF4]CEL18322.1 Lead, cadmium, zinc and mercury transporting ATPase; Copper-translocating P-type ATPase [Kibdelosporangium sp. MJ126-NF4]CTQ97806.1 Lead, cadmium, zinc and mercury transporting ATPase (EC 3.6.3.3) (EC 3.6.3.5); Copper-translocating P-type ATPase (EC 3.6.3.4) [Kibdelosporangium sp. MJ126-NF4]
MITGSDRQSWRLVSVPALVAAVLLAVLAGLLWLLGMPDASLLWTVAAAAGMAPLGVWAIEDLVTERRVGGALLTLPVVAGALVAGVHEVGAAAGMLACGLRGAEALVRGRARREVALLARAAGETRIHTGDRVTVGTGEIVPVDGRLLCDAVLDESPLSGDPVRVRRKEGEPVRSGVVNAGDPVELVATVPDTEGTWAAMSRLAHRAVTDGAAPLRRANRAALVYAPLAAVAGVVVWLVTGNPLAGFGVLAVAASAPVLLAVPLSLTAGLNRAARHGVVIGDAGVLERMARTRIGVVDASGVMYSGALSVTEVVAAPGWLTNDVLACASSAHRTRPDAFAGAVARAGKAAGIGGGARGGTVTFAEQQPDGSLDWVKVALARASLDNASVAWVALDGQPIGALLVRDEVRPDAAQSLRALRRAGMRRLVLVTGENLNDPEDVGVVLGVDELWTRCGTADKVERVREERRHGLTLMVGDDPAVGAADVGVALSGRGACVADVVIADGQVERLAGALRTARRTRWIGVLATVCGLAVVATGMAAATLGWLAPMLAVLVRAGIDGLVMVAALQPLRPGRPSVRPRMPEPDHLSQVRSAVRQAANELSTGFTPQAQQSVLRAYHLMADHVVPAQRTGEIERQVRRLGTHLTAPNAQVDDLRATMYGLNAVLNERPSMPKRERATHFTL